MSLSQVNPLKGGAFPVKSLKRCIYRKSRPKRDFSIFGHDPEGVFLSGHGPEEVYLLQFKTLEGCLYLMSRP